MNLLQETTAAITQSGHKPEDIIFVGSEQTGHRCNWEEFCKLADVEYDAGYGAPEVATDLIIVFSDGQEMWREDDDGREWWSFSAPFKMPAQSHPIKVLVGGMWDSLESLEEKLNKGKLK